MAISFNTGATANSASTQTTSQAITVPAGVLAGDVVLVSASQVTLTSTASTFTASSTGTTPTSAGSPVTGTEGLPAAVTGQVFWFAASATDAGKVVTITASAMGFWALALVAYTGASNSSPIDVISGAFGGASSGTVTCPTLSTNVANDWAVFLGGGAAEGSALSGPASSTSRENVLSSSNVAAAVNDSNASVGPGGTSIGGGTFTTNVSTNSILTAFTIGLAPPGTGGPAGTVQPRTTIPVARRKLARGLWGGGQGQAFVFVPAPHQPPYLPPRRILARVVWRGSAPFTGFVAVPAPRQPPVTVFRRRLARGQWEQITGQAFVKVPVPAQQYRTPPRRQLARVTWRGITGQSFVAVPAPRQQPQPAPRRRPARAVVQFTPVRTTNPASVFVPRGQPPQAPDDKSYIKKLMLLS